MTEARHESHQIGLPSPGLEIVTLIGPNGSGKSRTLGQFTRNPTGGQEVSLKLPEFRPTHVCAIANTVHDRFLFPGTLSPRYRYLGLRRSANALFAGAMTQAAAQAIFEVLVSGRSLEPLKVVSEVIGCGPVGVKLRIARRRRTLVEMRKREELLARKFAHFYENLSSGERTGYWREAEEVLFGVDDGDLEVVTKYVSVQDSSDSSSWLQDLNSLAGRYDLPFWVAMAMLQDRFQVSLSLSGEGDFESRDGGYLSAGEAALFSLFARLAVAVSDGSLVLIDEPELGLHPDWQAGFITNLRDSFPHIRHARVVIATHSPYLVAEADYLLLAKGEGEFEPPPFSHAGLSIDEIIYYAFGSRLIGSHLIERDLVELMNWMSSGSRVPPTSVRDAAWALSRAGGTHSRMLTSVLKEYYDRIDGAT